MMKTDQEQNHDWMRRRLKALDEKIADAPQWGGALTAMEEERKVIRRILGEAPQP